MRKFLFFTILSLFPIIPIFAQIDRFLIGVWSHSHDNATSSFHAGIITNVGNILQPKPELLVFPNPADDRLFVETSNGAGIVSIAICDMQGKIVAAGKDLPLNTGHLRQGVYFINVLDCNGNKYHHKIIKK